MISDEAEHYCTHRLALIGNAAHQTEVFGLMCDNILLNDAALLANVLIRAFKEG